MSNILAYKRGGNGNVPSYTRKNEDTTLTTVGVRLVTRNELKKLGQTGVPYDKTLMRIFQVLKANPEVRRLITEYDYGKGDL